MGGKEFDLFFQPEILNVFNEDAVIFPNAAILDATNGDFEPFDPFTTTPVEGVHYGLGPDFGQATDPAHFQTPRVFRFSVGFRF
jgi:hypothetical protein